MKHNSQCPQESDQVIPILRPDRDSAVVRKARNTPSEKQMVTLSCEECRHRKTRCDKSYPCGTCQRFNLECHAVRRCRFPRGRTGPENAKDAGLKERVAKLESLLADWQSYGDPLAAQSARLRQKASAVSIQNDQSINNEGANKSFWATLNDQVAGIRETLEEFPDDESGEIDQSPPASAANNSSSQHLDMILFGSSCYVVNPPEEPPKAIVIALLDIYIYRVDPILKVSHIPSLRSLLLSEDQGCSGSFDPTSREALRSAICFTAVCTLTEVESRDMFVEKKEKTMNRLRLATEVMLSRANLLTTSNITVLQAFVVYLAGRRTCPGYKKIWTLIASAVRIGQSLGLDNDERRFHTPFEMEIRKRVWYSIGLLDMQAAFDGGSHSVIANNGVLGRPPLNIDDLVLSSASCQPPFPEKPGLTDMSFNSMTHEGLIVWRRLTHVPSDSEGQPVKIRQEWANRSKIVTDWEQRIHERYLQYCDPSQPFQRYMKFVGQDMVITAKLLERRPMHRLFSSGPPPADNFNILELATNVIERSLLKLTDPALKPWTWFSWIKWYVLAIVLAELCGHGHGALTDRAWKVAEEAFPMLAKVVIDDVLWRSVEKLMRKARSIRDASQVSSLPVPAPIYPQAIPSQENIYTGRPTGVEYRLQTVEWSKPPTETSDSRIQLPPVNVNILAPGTWAEDSDYMSWVNWELFVQDVGLVNEQGTLGASSGGLYGID